MKMLAAALLAATLLAPAAAHADDARDVDVKASKVTFTIKHVLIEDVTGRVPIVKAAVTLAPNSALPASIDATLDPRRIDSGDGDRDHVLQGSDWFDTAKFPQWTFSAAKIAATSPTTFIANGMLTLHGQTVPAELHGTIVRGLPKPVYTASATVDRHAFGMAVTRADRLIGNEATIALRIELQ